MPPRLSPKPTPVTPDEPDGRRRRSLDSRARIVEAMLELVHGGELSPGAEQVAERAGVGLRSVFRHFKDMDSLYREMATIIEAELTSLIDRPIQANDPTERLIEIVGRRSAVFEKISPYKRAGELQRHRSAFLDAGHQRLNAISRDILRREMPPAAVRNRLVFEALDALLSWETWSRLRRDQGLTARRAREVLEMTVRRLIDEP